MYAEYENDNFKVTKFTKTSYLKNNSNLFLNYNFCV